MKLRYFSILILLALCISAYKFQTVKAGSAPAPVQPRSALPDTIPAIKHAITILFEQKSYTIYSANPGKGNISMYWKNDKGEKLKSVANLESYLKSKGKKLLFATNAGMYTEDNSPKGLYIENGKKLIPIDTSHKKNLGNFYIQPNGVFFMAGNIAGVVQTSDFHPDNMISFATQSGPMLIFNDTINPNFTKGSTNLNIRSGVGLSQSGEVVFAISNEPVNFYDFAILFRNYLYCKNALYLDGAISKMYIPELNRNDMGGEFGAMIVVTE